MTNSITLPNDGDLRNTGVNKPQGIVINSMEPVLKTINRGTKKTDRKVTKKKKKSDKKGNDSDGSGI